MFALSGTSRRHFLRLTGAAGLTAALAACGPVNIEISTGSPSPSTKITTPEQAFKRLVMGNQRYTATGLTHPHQTTTRRLEVAKGQKPFAIILGCADSRVAPEIIFDQGLGDLFVVRVAGNLLNDHALGSIEYAAEHLKSQLLVVLGHQRCGAVDAAVKGGEAPGQIGSLIKAIQPAVTLAKTMSAGELLDNAIKANVELTVQQLKHSPPILTELIEAGHLKVVGGRYELETGRVEFFLDDEKEKTATPVATPNGHKETKPSATPAL
jgi:carbonic anhydrase